jgi:adenine-specific DNA-methyltransferase
MSKYENLSKEELLQLVEKQEKELKNKKYGLVWDSEREPEQVVLDCENNLPILKRVKGKEIRTNNEDDNILIEGDNYHALTVLNYTHKEKIDVIYIDPPYNTGGSKEWKYNDRFVDINDGYRHSKWLNFLEKRLNIAKNLLSQDGIIFVSIDDNEVAQLKQLMNQTFDEDNFIGIFIRKTKSITSDVKAGLNIQHEYCLCYSKNIDKIKLSGSKKTFANYSNTDNDPRGVWTSSDPTAMDDGRKNKNTDEIINPYTGKRDLPGSGRRWRFNQDGFKKLVIEKRIVFKKIHNENERGFILKRYKNELSSEYNVAQSLFGENKYLNQVATKEQAIIFGKKVFDFPKPVNYIKDLLSITNFKKDDPIILDFFAGTGTTAHAILELNKEDEGKRKFILCTNNENKICEEITYPRIEKVINGYEFKGKDKTTLFEKKLTWTNFSNKADEINNQIEEIIEVNSDKYDKIENKIENGILKITGIKNIDGKKEGLGGNLQYFKTSFVKKTRNRDQVKVNLTRKCTEMICVKENIFNEEAAEEDFKLFSSNKKDKYLCVYYNFIDDSFDNFLNKLKEINGKKIIYMFSLENKVDKALFKGITNFTIEAIPQKILDVYKQLIKMNIPEKKEIVFVELNKANKKIFEENEKDDGARILRIVLHKTIQNIAQSNGINIFNEKGKEEKISKLNDTIKNKNVFTQVEWEENKTYLTIGNNAAHGEYDEYELKNVKQFYKHVQTLLDNFGL